MHKNQSGFSHIILLVAVVVIAIVGLAGWRVLQASSKKVATESSENSAQNDPQKSQESNACAKGAPGLFSKDVTDLSGVSLIQNPIRVIGGSNIKTHSFIEVRKKSPVYAPMDSTLTGGANYYETMGTNPVTKVQYLLSFSNGCNVTYWLDHLVDVPENIKQAFPAEPRKDTQGVKVKQIKIKAGDLVGYSNQTGTARFDFGVLDLDAPETILTTDPRFKNNEIVKTSDKYRYAVCPYQYYDAAKTKQYVKLFDTSSDSDQEIIVDLCKSLK